LAESGRCAHLRLEICHPVDPNGLCRVPDFIDGVVHRADERGDCAPVERRNEGAAHRREHVPRNAVGRGLERANLIQPRRDRRSVEHGGKCICRFDEQAGLPFEQIEIFVLMRKDPLKHSTHRFPLPPL